MNESMPATEIAWLVAHTSNSYGIDLLDFIYTGRFIFFCGDVFKVVRKLV